MNKSTLFTSSVLIWFANTMHIGLYQLYSLSNQACTWSSKYIGVSLSGYVRLHPKWPLNLSVSFFQPQTWMEHHLIYTVRAESTRGNSSRIELMTRKDGGYFIQHSLSTWRETLGDAKSSDWCSRTSVRVYQRMLQTLLNDSPCF